MVPGLDSCWITGQDFADHYNDQLKADVADQKDKNERQSSKVKKRDDLKKQLFRIRNDITKLQRLSGANLVQWSQTLNTLTSRVPEKTVWLTNLRIDSDRRVQITAYSCNEEKASKSPNAAEEKLTKGIQEFINVLLNHEYFSDVFLTGATKNLYEKKPVWRFEINCRLAREATSKTSED